MMRLRSNPTDIGFTQPLAHEWRRFARKWLGRPSRLPWHIALWNPTLLHWKQRLSRDPVENENKSHFRNLGNGRHRLAIMVHSDERGLCRHVIIPKVMVHHLEVPNQFACRGLQCYQ